MGDDQGNPFEPEEETVEEDAVCWKDVGRVCGPDCVAFDERSQSVDSLTSCWLINLGRSAAKNLSALAEAASASAVESRRRNDFYECEDKSAEARHKAAALKAEIERLDTPPPEVKT